VTRGLSSARFGLLAAALLCAALVTHGPAAAGAAQGAVAPSRSDVPRYSHLFVIVAENKGYDLIVAPKTQAPNLNRLANTYGLASQFFAEVHPSEGNYVAMLGGDTFGIHDDDAIYCKPKTEDIWCPKSKRPDYVDHTLTARSLMDQLESRGLTWKGYMEDLPEPGSLAVRWPTARAPMHGIPEQAYAAKHNGFVNFLRVQHDPQRGGKLVDFRVLEQDLASGRMPNYAHIVPNQCNDMHGRDAGPDVPADCAKGDVAGLIARGDRVIGGLVQKIMDSSVWKSADNVAVVITFDENDRDERAGPDQGCCGNEPGSAANAGGGRIPTIVITNHGPRGVLDATPYNHYSLLRTTEAAFGITEYLGHAADSGRGVVVMAPLFVVAR
jgi:phosphatidylinositol-3-phosphatase